MPGGVVARRVLGLVADIREDRFGANPILEEFGLRSYAGVQIGRAHV